MFNVHGASSIGCKGWGMPRMFENGPRQVFEQVTFLTVDCD